MKSTIRLVLIGFLQGALLLWMHKLIQWKIWPATSFAIVLTWYVVLIAVPLALQLMAGYLSDPRAWKFSASLAAILAALSVYAVRTSLGTRFSVSAEENGIFYFLLTVTLGWYVALPFAQSWLKRGQRLFPYEDLFEYSWNNILAILTAGFFTALFWGSLGLWAGMFLILKISFFAKLFTKLWFLYIVTASVFGFAISFGRSQQGLVSNLRKTMLMIFTNLLPLPAFIALIFLAALPFTGLKPLWDTHRATSLMLNLQLYVIFFLNAVYQDGKGEPPYNRVVRRLVEAGVIVLPVYAALCAHSLQLRIAQYGWSVSRVFAALAVFVTALYGIGYSWTALKRESPWMKRMGAVNVRIAAMVIGLAILVNTPLLDPRLIALRSQTTRLLRGVVSADQFDYDYLQFELGKAGRKELRLLSELQNHPQAELIRNRAIAVLAKKKRWQQVGVQVQTVAQLVQQLKLFPEQKSFDPVFLEFLLSQKGKHPEYIQQDTHVLAIDLNKDGTEEYIFFSRSRPSYVFYFTPAGWRKAGELRGKWLDAQEREKELKSQNYEVVAPEWNLLRIGKVTYSLFENNN